MHADPSKLRDLALWYREFAERAGNPTIREARLRTAEDLEMRADLFERNRPVPADSATMTER